MKLDYKFIKEILLTVENQNSNTIKNYDLMKNLNVISNNDVAGVINEDLINKYVEHIKILCSEGFFESSAKNVGFTLSVSGGYIISNVQYEMTLKGYKFLDVLKNDTIFNKIKNNVLSIAYNVGTQCLTTEIASQIKDVIS